MKKPAIPLIALTVLAACGSGPADDEILPGNWKMSAGMTNFEVPGATPEQAEMFKSAVGEMSFQEQCVSPQETKFEPETMSQAFQQGGDCTAGDFTVADGKIEGSLSCNMPDGNTSELSVTGTISPEKFAMSVDTEMVQEMLPEGKANVTIEVSGERIGDC